MTVGLTLPVWGQAPPTLWAMPPNVNQGQPMRELFERPGMWKDTRQRLFGIGYADHAFADYDDSDLRKWFPQIKRWGLKLCLEVGAIKPWGKTGTVAFQKSRKNWDRFLADGAEIDAIAMDEPLYTTLRVLHQQPAYCVEETANYIALVRENYPSWRIGDIEAYPSQDILPFIDALQRRLKQMNVRGLDFFRLDVDYMHFVPGDATGVQGWRGVRNLEIQFRRRNIPFSLIYWAADYPSLKRKGLANDMTWETSILGQGEAYRRAGGRPDEYVIEDWVKNPEHAVPETRLGTFMHSVNSFARRFLSGTENQ